MTSPPNPADRRLHPRLSMILQVKYPDQQEYFADWTENLSAGGLFVRTDQPFKMGDSLKVSISFPGLLAAVEITGTVAWIRPAAGARPRGVGLRVDAEMQRRKLAELALLVDSKVDQPGKEYTVLVAEDNDVIVRMYERVLARMAEVSGAPVRSVIARDGHEALVKLRQQRVDLVLTDLYMPVLDGFGVVRAMREDPALKDVPVLIVTSGGADEKATAHKLGVDAVLQKPVQFGQLLETVVSLLKRQGG